MSDTQVHARMPSNQEERARHFVVIALRSAIGLHEPGACRGAPGLDEAGERIVAAIASRNKIGGLVRHGALRAEFEIGTDLDGILKAQQSLAMAKSLCNLLETRRVERILSRENINYVTLKGPARSQQVFGGLDMRLSNDIDLLVRHGDYFRAGQVLCENGYRAGVSPSDRWWHDHLGESPFIPEAGSCTVDIHRKVQQPGGPSPFTIEPFISSATDMRTVGQVVRVLSEPYALLLAYISASKAIRNYEYWLGYAAEIAASRRKMSPLANEEFYALACSQGLSRLVLHIDQIVDCMFSLQSQSTPSRRDDWQKHLAALPFRVADGPRQRLHRSRLMWMWSDGNGLGRATQALGLMAGLMMADFQRLRRKEGP